MTRAEVSFLGPAEACDLTVQLGITSTKKLGQNFIHDVNTVRRIVTATDLPENSYPVEVDPGSGSLILGLLEHRGRATVVEIDHRLAARLPQTVTERAEGYTLELIEKGALKVSRKDFQTALDTPVANLPCNVSVSALPHMLVEPPTIRHVLVIVQSEAADQLAAQPGPKIYGVPNVKAAYYGAMRCAGTIGPHVFWPVPKVDSGLVHTDCYVRSGAPETSNVSGTPEVASRGTSPQLRARLFPPIDAAFVQRRRTLRVALSGVYGSGAAAEEAPMTAGIDPKRRGERLEIAGFIRLAEVSR